MNNRLRTVPATRVLDLVYLQFLDFLHNPFLEYFISIFIFIILNKVNLFHFDIFKLKLSLYSLEPVLIFFLWSSTCIIMEVWKTKKSKNGTFFLLDLVLLIYIAVAAESIIFTGINAFIRFITLDQSMKANSFYSFIWLSILRVLQAPS